MLSTVPSSSMVLPPFPLSMSSFSLLGGSYAGWASSLGKWGEGVGSVSQFQQRQQKAWILGYFPFKLRKRAEQNIEGSLFMRSC